MPLNRVVPERSVVVPVQPTVIAEVEKSVCPGRSSVVLHLVVAEITPVMLEKILLRVLRIARGHSSSFKESS